MDKKLSFIIADDHPLFRNALKRIIEKHPIAGNVRDAVDGEDVIRLLQEDHADVIFLDYSMPRLDGFDTARLILQRFPDKKIIILTQYDEIPVILNFFKMGVTGFLTKNAGEKEINDAIDTVVGGNYYYHSRFDTSISKWLAEGLTKTIPAIKFSERDMKLIILISKGRTSQEIGDELKLSIRSVETYRYKLLKSLGAGNTIELLNYVYKNGIV